MDHRISIVAAIGKNREIGKGNELLWKIPDDLKHFKETTKGHPIIMGRKTFESIGKPLPNRTNIVVSRDKNWSADGALAVESLEEAIGLAKIKPGNDEIFIIGGGQIYALALPYADKLYLTLIDGEKEADVFFPEYAHLFKKKTYDDEHNADGLKYRFVELER